MVVVGESAQVRTSVSPRSERSRPGWLFAEVAWGSFSETIRCTRAEINVWIKGIKAGECDNLTC